MMWIEGGTFVMGSDRHYPEESPARHVIVEGFHIDASPVTNREFAVFVEQTGYVSTAQQTPDPQAYPGVDPALLVPGSLEFCPPPGRSRLGWQQLWKYAKGVDWRTPPNRLRSSDIAPDDHPVVHVSYIDAAAFASWAGKRLPTEAEWEFAAWGGVSGRDFPWGDELVLDGRHMANTWQGTFPCENSMDDGWLFTSPTRHFPANGYGLYDMIGNVWEWTSDDWSDRAADKCCGDGPPSAASLHHKVIKGGSHLCAPNYCRRYRPPARQPQAMDTSTSHIGFRCVR